MRFIPILAKPDGQGPGQADEVFAGPLPAFYMNDFSVMGLRVSDCTATFALLASHGYALRHRQGCRGVAIRTAAEIRPIIELLAENGIGGEMADLVDQVYQG